MEIKMKLKKNLIFILIFSIFCLNLSTPQKEIKAGDSEICLNARHACLMDGVSRRILYGKDENKKVPMASTTKIMTCLIALEYGNFDEPATCSSYAASMPEVHLHASCGEAFNLTDLLYSLMLKSHNDSAVIIAENVAYNYIYKVNCSLMNDCFNLLDGCDFTFLQLNNKYNSSTLSKINSEQSKLLVHIFSGIMNAKAKSFNCNDTYFITPNGLDAQDENGIHSTTAKDLATIMSHCIGNEEFLHITSQDNYSFSSFKIDENNSFKPSGKCYSVSNANAMLHMYDNIISGKTGFTCDAGYCYVCAYKCENRTFIVSLLACGWPPNKTYKYKDTKLLLNYAKEKYFYKNIIDNTFLINPILVSNGKSDYTDAYIIENFGLLLSDTDQVNITVNVPSSIRAPILNGSPIGNVRIYINDNLEKEIPIYAKSTVESLEYKDFLLRVIKKLLS